MIGKKSKPVTQCPSEKLWQMQLDSCEFDSELCEHLESCSVCRQMVQQLAAHDTVWKEVTDTLSQPTPALDHITGSVCSLSGLSNTYSNSDIDQHNNLDEYTAIEVAQLQRLLPKASHPELLARIGRYELEQLVGRGGMGLVFRARDTELHRVVAVKTLGMSLWSVAVARERFVREGRAAAMLSHPHIVPMFDVITEGAVPALVMQYIAGPTLDQWIRQRGPLSWKEALRLGEQLASALACAHERGLVHRDIKPGNVLLEADGTRALLSDFGLVRAADDMTLTHSGLLAGTPQFMSPEQARGEDVDGRSDLFSLGCLLYFAMTGVSPFRGRESMAVLHAVCHSTINPCAR